MRYSYYFQLNDRYLGVRVSPYPTPADTRWVSIGQMASELGLSVPETQALIKAHGGIHPRIGNGRYRAEHLETLKAERGIPHRNTDHSDDWLTRYVKENSDD